MRLVRRVLAGAAAGFALGALFTTAALAAEPTTVEGDADATVTIGLGSDEGLGTDVDLDGILGVDDHATTDAVATLDGDATLNIGNAPATGGTASADVVIDAATNADTGTAPAADATANIDLGAAQASLAGVGNIAGSVILIDLDAGRDDAVGDAAASLSLNAGTDTADTSADAAASLVLGAGSDGSDTTADAAASLVLGAGSDGSDTTADAAGTLGEVLDLLPGAVLGNEGPNPDVAGGPADESEPAGVAAPADAGGLPLSLPDTAFGAGSEITIWGLLLAILAGLMVSARRLPLRRR